MTFEEFKKKELSNPEVLREYNALDPEFKLYEMLLNARIEKGFTQNELARLSGITQADISRIENGKRDPSLSVAQRLAMALGYSICFVPIESK